jgi:hypothetical protein
MICTWTQIIAIYNSTAKRYTVLCCVVCGVMVVIVKNFKSNSHTISIVEFLQVGMMTPIHSERVYTTTNNDSANRIRLYILAGLGRTLTRVQSITWNARFCELNDRFPSRIYANTRFQSYVLLILPENRFVFE